MLNALEEQWIARDVTSALQDPVRPDESLAFNELGDRQQRLKELDDDRIAAKEALGIVISTLALTPHRTPPLSPKEARRLGSAANDLKVWPSKTLNATIDPIERELK
jgi:hypothetical protein